MRVLIIGATGLLGKALLEEAPAADVVGTSSRGADIRDDQQVRNLLARHRPNWTILAAAYTDVDGCEGDPELVHQVNCLGAANVARAVRDGGSRLLFLSTDYVFDGSASAPYEIDHPVCPSSVYGRSKAEGEAAIREISAQWCIVRTAWLFGTAGKCFPNTILRLAEKNRELSVVADQVGSPTFNRDLAAAIWKLIQADTRGIIHATNSGSCSWFEFASEIVNAAGIADVSIRPITTAEAKWLAPRPKYSVLSAASLYAHGVSMRPWREALRAYLEERKRMQSSKSTEKVAVR